MFPLTRILCAIDFSAGSRHALDQAIALARQYDASVSALYVHRLSLPVPTAGQGAVLQPLPLTDVERGEIVRSLSEFVAEDRRAGVGIDTIFEEEISVPRAIVRCADHVGADLVVIGTHGHSGYTRLMLGSIANRVMKTARRPVLVVPPRSREAVPLQLARILCPIDFSNASASALEIGARLAASTGATMTVMHVLDLAEEDGEPRAAEAAAYRRGRFEQARACLQAAVAGRRGAGSVDELLLAGRAYREILRVSAEQQADLIVLGAQGRSALDVLMFGSTTHHVVRAATCPVLTVPPA